MPAITSNTTTFFAKSKTTSEIKSEILLSYFVVWHTLHYASLDKENEEAMLYVDLLTGPDMGQEQITSQLPILERLIQSTGRPVDMNSSVKTFFYGAALAETVAEGAAPVLVPHTDEDALVHAPVLLNNAENQLLLAELLATDLPAFAILNPLENGYVNQLLLNDLMQSNADLCMVFDADNLKQAVSKGKAGKALQEVLGADAFTTVKDFYKKEKDARKREDFFLPVFEEVFKAKEYITLTFRIGLPDTGLPGQYLVFASRTKAAYKKIKELMLQYTDYQADGVPVFGANQHHQQQLLLFPELNRYSILNLIKDLQAKAAQYNYKSIDKIAEDHSVATAYIPENYQLAFEKLRDQGQVQIVNHRTMQPIKKSTPGSLIKFTLK